MTSKIRGAVLSVGLSLALGLALPAVAMADEMGEPDSSLPPVEQQESSLDEQNDDVVTTPLPAGGDVEVQSGTEVLDEQTPSTDGVTDDTEVTPEATQAEQPQATDDTEIAPEATQAEQPQATDEASATDADGAADSSMQLLANDPEPESELEEEEGPKVGWETVDGKRYYRDASGNRVSGLQLIDGDYYYFEPSTRAAIKSWRYIDGKGTYHFDSTTYRASKYSQDLIGSDGKKHRFYFTGAGIMHTGWLTWNDSTKSFFAENSNYIPLGAAFTGWVTTSGKTYYFRPSDYRAARYSQKIPGRDGVQRNYYFNGAGAMQTGFVNWNDGTKSYYDPSAGAKQGSAVTGWKTISGKTYFFQTHNLRAARWGQNGLVGRDGKKHDYYFNGAGVMAIGAVNFGNTASLYGADGAKIIAQGWHTISSDKYYVRNQSPVRYNQTIDGKKYYFYGTYKLHRGWIYFSSTKTWAYYDATTGAESTPQPGWSISGGKYYFYTPDKQLTTWNKDTYESWGRIKSKTSDTRYLISVNLDTCYMNVFQKSGSLWVPIKGWMVSVGNDDAGCPTPAGTHKTTGQKNYYWGAEGNNCAWYGTVFYHTPGRWTAFHSVIYRDGSQTKITDPRLGYHITGSCVRMAIENAIWVYDNIGKGTTVHIY